MISLDIYRSNKDLVAKKKGKWINIRAHAFVKAWIQIVKRKLSQKKDASKNVSERVEPAMRKCLATRKAVAEKGEPAMRKLINKRQ